MSAMPTDKHPNIAASGKHQPEKEEATVPVPSIPRRQDLDALRAFTMLLGIALHAGLAYLTYEVWTWPVSD